MDHAKFLFGAALVSSLSGCMGKDNAIGRPCDLSTEAGAAQSVYNASASECPSNTCLKPVVQLDATMPDPPTDPFCSAGCSQDSDCEGEVRDPANPLDRRCSKGFTCGIPFVKGPLCCQKLCMCKDFLGPTGSPTPLACQGSGAETCAGTSAPMSSLSGVGQETDMYISVAPARMLDLVFMVDNSPSMAPKVAKMNQQFPKLIEALKDPNDGALPDLRVAIIDSDLGTGGAYPSGPCGPKTLPDGMSSIYGDLGRFQMIHAAACGVTNPAATYLEYKAGQPLNFAGDINTVFACLAGNLGVQGCGEQHSLQAFEFALVAGGLGQVNDAQHTMLRPDAYLGLVFLTDEDDCSAAPNDGMFGDKPELRGESASLRCSTRAHQCSGVNLTTTPPGYPTTAAFSAPLSTCAARADACPNLTDGTGSTDTSIPTDCSPLKDFRRLANEIKALKAEPDQILVAGIFGWPLGDADMATAEYKIDQLPNPNTADTAHPTLFDAWPVCYDPTHRPTNPNVYDATAAGWGATAGLRNAAFIDEFGANGLKFSICAADFSSSMKVIGDTIAKKVQNLCVPYKLVDAAPDTPGVQPDCRVVYRSPQSDPSDPSRMTYVESPTSMPMCPAGSTMGNVAQDCWQLSTDLTKCPGNGQWIQVLRTASEIQAGPLTAGTKIGMQCRTCPDTMSGAAVAPGCE